MEHDTFINEKVQEFERFSAPMKSFAPNSHATTVNFFRQALTDLLAARDAEVVEEQKELYEALQMMWEQYCPEPFTHKYMTAGENCEVVLQKFSHLRDAAISLVQGR